MLCLSLPFYDKLSRNKLRHVTVLVDFCLEQPEGRLPPPIFAFEGIS